VSFPGARIARWLRASAFEVSGVHARQRRRLDGTCAAILMYHRVLPRAEAARLSVEPGMYVTPETFARHLDWLRSSFRVLPLSEVVDQLLHDRPLPEGACSITFDDGWRDNFSYALPALRERDLSAAVFLVIDRVGTLGAFWPDELSRSLSAVAPGARAAIARQFGLPSGVDPVAALLSHFKGLRQLEREEALAELRASLPGGAIPIERELLDWPEVNQMAAAGIEFESHGSSHAILTGVDLAAAEAELRDSRSALLERGLGGSGVFAYPSGAFDASLQRIVHECGYRAAVTTERGLAHRLDPPTAYPRIGIHDDISRTKAEFHRRVPGGEAAD
jgi:peptidoglycan/xylan/chitin deacetylase (PgdA/CDA1 family)